MIRGISHVGISVRDLTRSVRFYRDLLGMDVVVEPTPFHGPLYEQILDEPGVRGTVALLKRQSLQLELFQFDRPVPIQKDPNFPVSAHGISHFCIDVLNIEAEYERLKSAGVRFHCPPLNFSGEALATYARDLDGNVFELLQRTARRDSPDCRSGDHFQ